MESSAINLCEEKSGGDGEKKAGQDGTAEAVGDVTGEMKPLASQVNQVICGGKAGVLGILPEELWLKILEEVVDSAEDIQNILSAFPELDKLFQKKKASWLFPLMLPHLVTKHLVAEANEEYWTWTCSEELLKLRLVSKRWKNAVEITLQNDASRRPLPPQNKNAQVESNVVTIPENHFSYHRIRKYPLGASRFEQVDNIDRFLGEMGDFQGNPFPGKSVFLQIFVGTSFREVLAKTVVLLQRFGEHVLDLQIDYWGYDGENVGDLDLYRNILRCLSLVPNIRSLIFTGDLFGARDLERDNFFGDPDPESQVLFPQLRNLERFEWRMDLDFDSVLTTRMLETYGRKDGLRKLGITLGRLSTVDLAFYQSVHLTELHLILDDDCGRIVDRIGRVVKALPNHQEIRKFWLTTLEPSGCIKVRVNELIRMLAEFKFESVVLQDLGWVEEPLISEPSVNPPITVSSLDLEEKGELRLSFDFLRLLPNLKFLSVKIGCHGRRQVLEEYRKMKRDGNGMGVDLEVGSFGKILRRYFMKAYDSSLEIPENAEIWKEIPSLEMISLSMPVMTGVGEVMSYLGVRFVRECGNKAFFGPIPDAVKWDEEEEVEVENHDFGRGIGLMVNDFVGW